MLLKLRMYDIMAVPNLYALGEGRDRQAPLLVYSAGVDQMRWAGKGILGEGNPVEIEGNYD